MGAMTPRLVHLSDLHLGFRAFPRTEQGSNLRERDIALAFRWALQETIRLRPDLLLITGDLFDHPDPPHTALLAFHRGVALLRSRLPGCRILLIAGGRDTPAHPAELGPVALLDVHPGVEAAAVTPRTLRLRDAGIHALLVPHRASVQPPWPEIRPDPSARWNILLIRGEFIEGPSAIPVDFGEWNYVAVGGPHRPTVWAPHVRAAGALERPERDPWGGAGEERGFYSYDLGTRTPEFHPVPCRAVVDLAPVRVSSSDPLTGARRLREVVEGLPGGIDGKIVRVRLTGDVLTPEEGVSAGLVAALAERAAHVEYRIAGTREISAVAGSRAPDREGEPFWRPSALIVRGTGTSEGEEALPLRGVVLLTAETDELRGRLARELREGAPLPGHHPLLRPDPPLPSGLDAIMDLVMRGDPDPEGLLRRGVALLNGPSSSGTAPAGQSPGAPTPSDGGAMESPEEILLRHEGEVQALRADWVEATGDVEARMLEWVRERQDADSHLQGYRDRARELRGRLRALESEGKGSLCPTCGKPIGEHLPRLLETLRDEWEAVVQDGRWWKRRREQLELKPADLRKMEEKVLRLHADLEEKGEGLEREKERERILHRIDESDGEGGGAYPDESPPSPLGTVPGVRDLLREAGTLLHTWTGGRIQGMRAEDFRIRLLGRSGEARLPDGSEQAIVGLALRFAVSARLLPEEEGRTLLLWELHESGSSEVALSLIESLVSDLRRDWLVLAVVPPSLLGRAPESYDLALEFRSDERGRIRSRRIAGGIPQLRSR